MQSPCQRKAVLASVLTAGTALVASDARAEVIVTDIQQDIGFKAGDVPAVSVTLPGGAQFVIQRFTSGPNVRGISASARGSLAFFSKRSFLTRARFGGFPHGRFASYGNIQTATRSGATSGGKFSNKYFLFVFNDTVSGNFYESGWIKGSVTGGSFDDLTYHFDSYAYDTSGNFLPAGFTDAPEPASATLALLAALTVGSAGVRRWKALRVAGADQAGGAA